MPSDRATSFAGTKSSQLEVLAPTGLEYWAVRSLCPPARVVKTGVGLSHWRSGNNAITVVCGLAGGLVPELAPGTVLVPDLVGAEDGTVQCCDAELRNALVAGARALGFNPDTGPLLTSKALITGAGREKWARQGYVAADMEGALLAGRTERFAVVRVVLDSPLHSISDLWLAPGRAILDRSLWPELLWLSWSAPRYAVRAARVLREGLSRFLQAE